MNSIVKKEQRNLDFNSHWVGNAGAAFARTERMLRPRRLPPF